MVPPCGTHHEDVVEFYKLGDTFNVVLTLRMYKLGFTQREDVVEFYKLSDTL